MSGVEEGAALASLAAGAGEAGAGAAAAGGTAAAGGAAAGLGAADAAGMGAAGLGAADAGAGLAGGLGMAGLGTGAMDLGGMAGTGLLSDPGLAAAAMDSAGIGSLGTGAMDMGGMTGTSIPGSAPPSFMSQMGDKIGTGMKTLGRAQQLNGLLNPGRVGTAQPGSAAPQQQSVPMPPPMRVQPPGAPGSQQGIKPTPSQIAILKRMGLLGGMNG